MIRRILPAVALAVFCVSIAAAQEPDIPALLATGDAAHLRGDYEAARAAFEQAWAAAQQTPPENPQRYDALKRLVTVSAASGRLAGAGDYIQLAISWRETAFGGDDPKVLEDMVQSAAICRALKDTDRAAEILNRVFTIHVRLFGMESKEAADDLSRMAQISLDRKQLEDAASSLAAAVRIRAKVTGPLHATLVADLDRLGETRIALRDYPGAEGAYRYALVIREGLYGREHPDLIASVDGLSYSLFGQKKYDEAEPVYLRLIGLWEKSVGPDHPMLAVALEKLAVFYAAQKKFEQARQITNRGNFVRAHFLGLGLSGAATEQMAEGNQEAARALYDRALAVLDPADEKLKAEIAVIRQGIEFKTEAPPVK
jgi:tetratricopeptide (TPR) repeat protein